MNIFALFYALLYKSRQEEPDDDKDFLMSLIPSVKTLNADNKLLFRMQVMQLLLNLKGRQYKHPFEPQRFSEPFPAHSLHNSQPLNTQMIIPTYSHAQHNSLASTVQPTQTTVHPNHQNHSVISPAAASPASDTSHMTDNSVLSFYDLDA